MPEDVKLHCLDGDVRNCVPLQADQVGFEIDSVDGAPVVQLKTTGRAVLDRVESVVADFRGRSEPATADHLPR